MNTLTPDLVKALETQFRDIAYEPIQVQLIDDKVYALGSELAVHRLAQHFKSFDIGCSTYFALAHGTGWYYDHKA
jgi:hypothetical protein